MKRKYLAISTFLLLGVFSLQAQSNINNYKYVTVPYFFEFVKGKNAHRLNTTTRFLLKKNGLNAFMDDELTANDYKQNNCLALQTDVIKINALLKTKLKVVLKNCNDEVIFESKVGESKAKSYDEAYQEALMDACESFADLNYKYTPANQPISKEEPEETIETPKEITVVEEQPKHVEKIEQEVAKKEVAESTKEEVIESVESNIQEKVEIEEPVIATPKPSNVLYAQAIDEGYQVVDSTPKVVMVLLKTSLVDVFLVADKNAIVFKENGLWVISKNKDGEIIKEILELKF